MELMKWVRERSEALGMCDIAVVKLFAMLVGVVVGALFAPVVKRNIGKVLALTAVTGVILVYRWFTVVPDTDGVR